MGWWLARWAHGVALLATAGGLRAHFSGLCVVCGSCLVASSAFMERRPICPETRGRNAPLHHVGITQCCSYAPDDRQCHSNGLISQVAQWSHMPFPGGCISQGCERNGGQTAREATTSATNGLAGYT
jgi:hypothetical protein